MALDTASDAFAQRTVEGDSGHWKVWKKYCVSMNADPHRPPVDPATDRVAYMREVVLLVNALVYFMRTRKPRSNADLVIKPQSAMNILLGANRVMRASYSSFIPLKALKLPLRGLMRRFVQRFGPASLVPKRREPFTNGMIKALTSLPDACVLGSLGCVRSGSLLSLCWRAAVALAVSTGFRKAELFLSNETTHFIHWRDLTWIINKQLVVSPSNDELNSLKEGDYLAVRPVPSKADQMNLVWGAHPLYLPFHEESRNAPAALRDLGLKVGRDERDPERAVFISSIGVPVTGAAMASAMFAAVSLMVGSVRAKLFTWHSARALLAMHLLKCKVPPATIQAMLRWQTDESLRAYARLDMNECGEMLDRAARAVVTSVQTTNMPLYERFDFFLALHEMADAA